MGFNTMFPTGILLCLLVIGCYAETPAETPRNPRIGGGFPPLTTTSAVGARVHYPSWDVDYGMWMGARVHYLYGMWLGARNTCSYLYCRSRSQQCCLRVPTQEGFKC